MLNIGTKVFVKNLYKNDRPDTPYSIRSGLRFIEREYGYIVDCADKYRVGGRVRICDLSEEEKLQYPGGWYAHMGEHIGQTAPIARHVGSDDLYQLEGINCIWHASNLKPASEFIGF